MVGVEVSAEVDRLAERLQRSVVLDDPQVRPLLTTRHYGDEDAVRVRAVLQRDPGAEVSAHVLAQGVASWRTPGRVAPREDLGLAGRWCAPVRHDDELLGLLLVIDADATLDAAQRDDVRRVAERLGPLLAAGEERAGRARTAGAVLVLLGLVDGDRAAAASLLGLDRTDGPVRVLVVDARDRGVDRESHRAVLARALTSVDLPLHAAHEGRGWVLLPGPTADASAARDSACRLRAELAVLAPAGRAVAGLGGTVVGSDATDASAAEARAALRAASLGDGEDGTVCWDDLGALAPLLLLPEARLTDALVPAPLRALVAADRDGVLEETVATYLDRAGNAPAAAAALHVHRTTLYYRLSRIEAVTGLDLADGQHRLLLHQGLLLRRLLRQREENA